jgi:two-component system OmpR family sensor kinase
VHEQLSGWWGGVSLRTKITGVTVLLVTLGLLVAGVGTMTVLRNYLLTQVDSNINVAAKDITTVTSTCEQSTGPIKFFCAK